MLIYLSPPFVGPQHGAANNARPAHPSTSTSANAMTCTRTRATRLDLTALSVFICHRRRTRRSEADISHPSLPDALPQLLTYYLHLSLRILCFVGRSTSCAIRCSDSSI